MNMEIRSKRKMKKKKEETEAVASNKAVRSKRKKMMMMKNRFLSHLFASKSAIKKKKKKKKKKMNKEETSNQVRNYLHHDIVICILSKLPLKSFKRFECVCKSWATLFQDSYFNTIYANYLILSNNNNHYDDTYLNLDGRRVNLELELGRERRQFCLLPGQRFEDRVKIDWPSPFQEEYGSIYILGTASIDGILCLYQRHERRFVLWNPTTGEFKVIPFSLCEYVPLPPNRELCHDHRGFGYDHVTHDYKVIHSVDTVPEAEDDEFWYSNRPCLETFWIIYSLRSNSWRKLDLNLPNHYCCMPNHFAGVYTNGVCHWWTRIDDPPNTEDSTEYLLSFNFSNELMFRTPSPSYLDVRRHGSSLAFVVDRCLVHLKESIALLATDLKMATVQISILGELGVRESWTKLFTVTCLPPSILHPIGVGNLSNTVLFRKKDNKLAWVDLNTKMMEEVDVKVGIHIDLVNVGKYKKSFLPMGGMNN